MKPSNPGEKSFLSTKKKGNVIINPKKEDLMKETKLQEKKAAKTMMVMVKLRVVLKSMEEQCTMISRKRKV